MASPLLSCTMLHLLLPSISLRPFPLPPLLFLLLSIIATLKHFPSSTLSPSLSPLPSCHPDPSLTSLLTPLFLSPFPLLLYLPSHHPFHRAQPLTALLTPLFPSSLPFRFLFSFSLSSISLCSTSYLTSSSSPHFYPSPLSLFPCLPLLHP